MEIETRELGQKMQVRDLNGPKPRGKEAALGWCWMELRDPRGMCHAEMKPVGLAGSGAHAKASGTSLPANQSCASLFLTRHFAGLLISILAG